MIIIGVLTAETNLHAGNQSGLFTPDLRIRHVFDKATDKGMMRNDCNAHRMHALDK